MLILVVTQAASLGVGIYLHSFNVGMMLFGLSSLLVTFSIDMNILYLLGLSVWRVALRSIGLVTLTLTLLYAVRLSLQHLFNYNQGGRAAEDVLFASRDFSRRLGICLYSCGLKAARFTFG